MLPRLECSPKAETDIETVEESVKATGLTITPDRTLKMLSSALL